MHTLEEASDSMEQCVRLLQLASSRGDWELCSELARFLMAMDEWGDSAEGDGQVGPKQYTRDERTKIQHNKIGSARPSESNVEEPSLWH